MEETHKGWYTSVCQIAEEAGVQPSRPRAVKRQTMRADAPADTVEDYYRLSLSIPFIDHILSEFQSRFVF